MKISIKILLIFSITLLAITLTSCVTRPVRMPTNEIEAALENFEHFPVEVVSVEYESKAVGFNIHLYLGQREIKDEYMSEIRDILYDYFTSEQFIDFARSNNDSLIGRSDRYRNRRLIIYDRYWYGIRLSIRLSSSIASESRSTSMERIINEYGQN